VRWAFTDSAIRRIEAVVWVENAASVRVLEKCGFEREGCLRGYRLCRGVPRDFYAYALLRPQVVDAPANPLLQPTGSAGG
jgi:RimJ/RimL family protein N-acetyltransferase